MNRRTFLGTAGAGLLPGLRAEVSRPNILIVMTDQQFADALSCRMGRQWLHTPNMDSLAATGTFFTRAYCANPLCVPSRTSMFSGRYPVETDVQDNNLKPIDAARFPMMGTLFKNAGYSTAYFGKWHIPYGEKQPVQHGFDVLMSPKGKGNADIRTTAAAVKFLAEKPRQPFLMVASLLNPHNICEWARGEKLPDGEIGAAPPPEKCPPLRANHQPQRNEPDAITLMRRSYQSWSRFPVGNFDEDKWRQYIWAYYRMIEKVDAQVGQVLGALREARAEEGTLVVCVADHGDCQGSHRWSQKTVFYDEAARVPLILSYRGMTKPGTSDRLVNTGVDLIPTLCGYAGMPVPKELPGLDLGSTANGHVAKDPREFVMVSNRMLEGAEVDGRQPAPEGRMVRSRRFKYCVHSEGARRESLVDMERDPGETVNVAGEVRYAGELNRHRAMLAGWARQTGDRFPV